MKAYYTFVEKKWGEFERVVEWMGRLLKDRNFTSYPFYTVWKGGTPLAIKLFHSALELSQNFTPNHILSPLDYKIKEEKAVIIEDIIDTRKTLAEILDANPGKEIYYVVWIKKQGWQNKFISQIFDKVMEYNERIRKHIRFNNMIEEISLLTPEESKIQIVAYESVPWDVWVKFPWEV